jgi:3-hydroxyisobutyrate dehydrogenase
VRNTTARSGTRTISSRTGRSFTRQCPELHAAQKADIMLAGDFTAAFALKHALKDPELAAVTAQASGTELTLTQALLPRRRRAASDGHAEDDLAAIYATT